MAKTKKGRPVDGWVIVNKPAGVGSTQVVGKVRWAFQAQKAGHSGTLDPDATGVLAVALGEATKTVPYVADTFKCYRFMVTFGSETTTDDASGETIRTSAQRPSLSQINEALEEFRGQIEQVPPQVSAVKVDGARAYDLARDGIEMDLAARPLWVEDLKVLTQPDADHLELMMICGKGGYVRSIARDLGRKLGCLGHVEWLHREWSGPFHIQNAVDLATLEQLARSAEIDRFLTPLEAALSAYPEVRATPEGAVRLRNGNAGLVLPANLEWGEEAWASLDGKAIAVGHYRAGELHPTRVFNR